MAAQARIDPAALDRLFEPFDRTDAPGFAVGVALRGLPGYRRGVGLASIELPVALSPSIRMRIGSTTKHFCCLAVMLLAEEGRLSIADSPRRYLPELPAWADAMTIRQLMAHTSGMRDSLDLVLHAAGPGRPAAADMQFRLLSGLDSVNFEPGASWSYNNGGYVLLTEIIERVGGRSFADVVFEDILQPVGMHDSLVRPLDTELVPNSATLHVPLPGGGWARGVFGTPIGGEGGIVSTVDDMLLWLRHMSRPVVGTPETWAQMLTPLATHGYGLGLSVESYRGLRIVHHAGSVVGGSSQMLKVLDHELDLIIMSNGRSGLDLYRLVGDIIDACIPGLPPVPDCSGPPPTRGTFHSNATGRVLTLVEHENRQAIGIGSMTLPARYDEAGTLSVAMALFPTDLRITPVREGEAVVAIEAVEFGQRDRLDRVEAPDAAAAAGPPPGRYESPAAGLLASITQDAQGGTTLRLSAELGTMDYALTAAGPGLWQARGAFNLGPTLEFDADGFRLTTGRTVRLRFRRIA